VAEPGQHLAKPVEEILAASGGAAIPGPTVEGALHAIAAKGGTPGRVLVCGSLYLAGEVLKADGTAVDCGRGQGGAAPLDPPPGWLSHPGPRQEKAIRAGPDGVRWQPARAVLYIKAIRR
jgi:hypothetical protein